MDTTFFNYLQQLELMAFFSGYPLIYFVILSLAGNKSARPAFKTQLVSLLPLAYALTGTLYLGLQLRNLYPDYSMAHIKADFQYPFLKTWGLLSVFFWLPLLRKKPVISLLHSLVFFFLLIRDFYLQLSSASADGLILKNEMKVYTDSILINFSTFAAISIVYFLISRFRKNVNSSGGS